MKTTKPNPVRDKSYAFAIRVVRAAKHLQDKKREFVLSRQLLTSGTSIGANVREALHAQSRKEFISKLQIEIKEAFEAEYWICLLRDSSLFSLAQADSLLKDISELQGLLTSIIKTSKRKR